MKLNISSDMINDILYVAKSFNYNHRFDFTAILQHQ